MLKLVVPTKAYEKQAVECIKEFYEYNSEINGTGSFDKYVDDYDGWLEKLKDDENAVLSETKVPRVTFFLVREEDDKIIGFMNIRLAMNNRIRNEIGHIGYSIRPTERKKGYNKINLYLALKFCNERDMNEVKLFCYKSNPGSRKTMEALGGVFVREFQSIEDVNEIEQEFVIDVKKALREYTIENDKLIKRRNENEICEEVSR